MSNPDTTLDAARKMSYDDLLLAAGSPQVTGNTYLYVDLDGDICSTEKPGRDTTPADEYAALGYARRLKGVV